MSLRPREDDTLKWKVVAWAIMSGCAAVWWAVSIYSIQDAIEGFAATDLLWAALFAFLAREATKDAIGFWRLIVGPPQQKEEDK